MHDRKIIYEQKFLLSYIFLFSIREISFNSALVPLLILIYVGSTILHFLKFSH